jgi:two-component system, NtrC family, nitrogen regulation response regulator GlnG
MKNIKKILVVDDEENIRRLFKKALEKKNYTVHSAQNAEDALQKIKKQKYILIFSDIFMDGESGLTLIKNVKKINPQSKIVIMTAQDTMNNTIEAMQAGAYDYISKPFDFENVYNLVDRVEASREIPIPSILENEVETREHSIQSIVGKSPAMQDIFKTIGKSAASDLSVLITGESGTGKELIAQTMHYYSKRKDHPFVCINCAAISRELLESELFGHEKGAFTGAVDQKKGKFEIAKGGTLFLDEIGDMEPALQAKILRVLQNKDFYRVGGKEVLETDVRIVAATNQNLEGLMKQKLFREDLFHRLNVINISIPPLRDRMEDVTLLADYFLKKHATNLSHAEVFLSPEAVKILTSYSWKGNIRELENVIKRAVVLASAGPILSEHLPDHIILDDFKTIETDNLLNVRFRQLILEFFLKNQEAQDGRIYEEIIQLVERQLFEVALDKHSGKQVSVAKTLGINRNTLKRKIDAMKIEVKKNRPNNSP